MLAPVAEVRFYARDGSGSRGSFALRVLSSTSPTAALNAAVGLVGPLTSLTDVSWYDITLTYRSLLEKRDGAGSYHQAGAFVFECSEIDTYYLASVPGLRDELVLNVGDGAELLINEQHPDVQNFATNVVNGIWTNPFSNNIARLSTAFRQVREKYAFFSDRLW